MFAHPRAQSKLIIPAAKARPFAERILLKHIPHWIIVSPRHYSYSLPKNFMKLNLSEKKEGGFPLR
jgi:hypothetical protein